MLKYKDDYGYRVCTYTSYHAWHRCVCSKVENAALYLLPADGIFEFFRLNNTDIKKREIAEMLLKMSMEL